MFKTVFLMLYGFYGGGIIDLQKEKKKTNHRIDCVFTKSEER